MIWTGDLNMCTANATGWSGAMGEFTDVPFWSGSRHSDCCKKKISDCCKAIGARGKEVLEAAKTVEMRIVNGLHLEQPFGDGERQPLHAEGAAIRRGKSSDTVLDYVIASEAPLRSCIDLRIGQTTGFSDHKIVTLSWETAGRAPVAVQDTASGPVAWKFKGAITPERRKAATKALEADVAWRDRSVS